MTMQFDYPARLTEEEAGFWLVTFPDLPEAGTDARTRDDALREAVDCLEEAIAGRLKRGDEIPAPSHPAGWASGFASWLRMRRSLDLERQCRRESNLFVKQSRSG